MGRPAKYPVQEFNGVRYYLKGRYYQSDRSKPGPRYMHRAVWEFHNGPIPENHHVHHKDGNGRNNDINNLALMSESDHQSMHGHERGFPHWRKGVEAARTVKRDWSRIGSATWAGREPKPYNCVFCGEQFLSRVLQRVPLFCGQNCQKKYRRREAKQSPSTDIQSSC